MGDRDLAKYSQFAVSLHQQRGAMGTGVSSFKFPDAGPGGGGGGVMGAGAGGGAVMEEEEEDLYN